MFLTTRRQSTSEQPLLGPRELQQNGTQHSNQSASSEHNTPATRPRRRDPTKFATAQYTLLAFVRLSEPVALTSILPYAYKFVLSFNVGRKSDASFYTGILIAAFAFAESLTGMYWGKVSDRVGRKPVLLAGVAGTVLSLLVVGFSTNFWMALFGRALGGFLNGNVGVIQTMVGELVTKPEHEARAFAIMPFVWSLGTMIGPAIGGYFAEPSENFPTMFSADGIFGRYPYLLPNLICVIFLVLAIVAGAIGIEETHPDMQPQDKPASQSSVEAGETPNPQTSGSTINAPADLTRESYGTFNAVEIEGDDRLNSGNTGCGAVSWSPLPSKQKLLTRQVVMMTIALGIFTYHAMVFDTIWPIFLQDEKANDQISIVSTRDVMSGGLGMNTQQVGIIMSMNGLLALITQGIVFPYAAAWLGNWRLFVVCTICHPLSYLLVPFLAFSSAKMLYPAIYALLSIRNLLTIMPYPLILIFLKEAAPTPAHLGRVNGLAASVGAACRTMASPIAGYLYSVGTRADCSLLPWWSTAVIAVFGAGQLWFMSPPNDKARVHDLRHFASVDDLKSEVQVSVEEVDAYSSDEEAGR